jgi:hypothetical protein
LEDGAVVTIDTLKELNVISTYIKKLRVLKPKSPFEKRITFADDENIHLTKGAKEYINK